MSDFTDILTYAIQLESDSVQIYQKLAAKAAKPEISKFFLEMEAQEQGHKKRLERFLERGSLPQTQQKITLDEDLGLAEILKGVDLSRENLNYQDALIIGMKLEKAALELYRGMVDFAPDEDSKELFQYLADEEAKHKYSFEKEFDDLFP